MTLNWRQQVKINSSHSSVRAQKMKSSANLFSDFRDLPLLVERLEDDENRHRPRRRNSFGVDNAPEESERERVLSGEHLLQRDRAIHGKREENPRTVRFAGWGSTLLQSKAVTNHQDSKTGDSELFRHLAWLNLGIFWAHFWTLVCTQSHGCSFIHVWIYMCLRTPYHEVGPSVCPLV